MASFSREVIENIRSQTDIVDLVSGYLPLTRSGKNFKARCPFHEEKTASFNVSPDRQIYKCFGCGRGGSVFDFVMEMDRLEFPEAVGMLAERAGVTLEASSGNAATGSGRSELYRVHDWAQRTYQKHYRGPEGAAARRYIEARGFSSDTAASFALGFAPGGGDMLVRRARSAGVPEELLERSGLAVRSTRGPGLRDRFWDTRIMFPIRDTRGRVVAFGGRSLDGAEPKYLNSSESDLFQKGRMLFGLDRLRDLPREAPVLVVEGYTDVMMAEQSGVRGVVATLGTSLTPEHARLLARYSDRVVLVYDGDSAGLAAAERGGRILLQSGHLGLRVATLPEGQDPCDWFQARGHGGLETLLERSCDLVDFLIRRVSAAHDLETVAGRHEAARRLLDVAAGVEDPVDRELVQGRIAEVLGLSPASLQEHVARTRRRQRSPRDGREHGQARTREDRELNAQRQVVQALLNQPGLAAAGLPSPEIMTDPRHRALLEALRAGFRAGASSITELLDGITDPALRTLAGAQILEEGHGRDLEAQLEGAVRCLENRRVFEAARRLKERSVASSDPEADHDIRRIFQSLKVRRRRPEATGPEVADEGGDEQGGRRG